MVLSRKVAPYQNIEGAGVLSSIWISAKTRGFLRRNAAGPISLLMVIFALLQNGGRVVEADMGRAVIGTKAMVGDYPPDGLSSSDWDDIRAAFEAGWARKF